MRAAARLSVAVGQTGGAGDVPDRTVEGLMGGEEAGNELRCL